MAKQNPHTFTLVFNSEDPHQVKAAEIINRQARSKSSFITSSVLHYVDCEKIPASSMLQEQQMEDLIERIVKRTVEEVLRHLPAVQQASAPPPTLPQQPTSAQVQQPQKLATPQLSEGDSSTLLAGLNAFRKNG